jgi:cation:H+ antiporter
MPVVMTVFVTLVLLFAIVWACSVFTNGIEWLGHRFKLSEGAVGSVLAAVGTALPETLVPTVALLGGYFSGILHPEAAAHLAEDAEHIGVGAILGAPFLLSTLAMCLVGGAVYYFSATNKRGVVLHIDLHLFKRDLTYFFPAYGLVYLASFIPSMPVKWGISAALVAFYALYVYRTLKIEHVPDEEFHLDPLILAPRTKEPSTTMIVFQSFLGLLGIIVMAHLFVQQISTLSTLFNISPLLLSLIIAPIATELPEKFNSIVWIAKKKDNLALGNITGAMVFQSCIPTAIGLSFTPWILDAQGTLSVLLCFASAGVIYASILYRRLLKPNILLIGGVFYLIFLFYSVVKVVQG